MAAICVRTRCGICVEVHTVSCRSPGLYSATNAARLHRDGNQSLIYNALLDDLVCLLERAFYVAALELQRIRDVVLVAVVKKPANLFSIAFSGSTTGVRGLVIDFD